ncbi:ankyrin repeat domain-containing protein [Vagococcus vulneris]|uniref:Uncharacterized protein n=1 Tax=Vagococcus vulneris TaxID=1977869 RepID=A0A429ZVK4_9ENTE|nr:ankyrin repeat domain-containing protein [Vagococcus vulneris]RST97692.1 hypothetical protein CBF37_09465 [Vagococcus vulneris]
MIHIVKVISNCYVDSVLLGNLSEKVNLIEGVNKAIIAMGTDRNKEVMKRLDLLNEDIQNASVSDLIINLSISNSVNLDEIIAAVEALLNEKLIIEETGYLISYLQTTVSEQKMDKTTNTSIVLETDNKNHRSYHEIFQPLTNGLMKEFDDHAIVQDHRGINSLGQTDLMLAVLAKNITKTAKLLELGSDPNHKDNSGLSPFIAAAANGLSDIFELILHYCPDIQEVNHFGGTALLPSSEKGYLNVVRSALKVGVSVNHVNRLGWTALLEAVIFGNGGYLYQIIINELIMNGADISIKDFEEKIAIDYATELKQKDVIKLLNNEKKMSNFIGIDMLIKKKNYIQALRDIAKLPNSLEKLFYQGMVYEQMGYEKEAEMFYRKGAGFDVQFIYYLAQLKRRQGRVEEALSFFKYGAENTNTYFYDYQQTNYLRELGKHQEAVNLTETLLAKYPSRVDFMFHLANSLTTIGENEKAQEILKKAATIQPTNNLFL